MGFWGMGWPGFFRAAWQVGFRDRLGGRGRGEGWHWGYFLRVFGSVFVVFGGVCVFYGSVVDVCVYI